MGADTHKQLDEVQFPGDGVCLSDEGRVVNSLSEVRRGEANGEGLVAEFLLDGASEALSVEALQLDGQVENLLGILHIGSLLIEARQDEGHHETRRRAARVHLELRRNKLLPVEDVAEEDAACVRGWTIHLEA